MFVTAGGGGQVPEGDHHSVRHSAETGVQHDAGGGPQGGLSGSTSQGVLPGLRVRDIKFDCHLTDLLQPGARHEVHHGVREYRAARL